MAKIADKIGLLEQCHDLVCKHFSCQILLQNHSSCADRLKRFSILTLVIIRRRR